MRRAEADEPPYAIAQPLQGTDEVQPYATPAAGGASPNDHIRSRL